MGLDGWISGLNYFNAGLGAVNYGIDAKQNGATNGQAWSGGIFTGALNGCRAAAADDMKQRYGTYDGYMVNNMFGWNSPQSSAAAFPALFTTGMANEMMYNPFSMGFGMPMMGMNPFMGGMGGGFYC